jgi:hypothetical protein
MALATSAAHQMVGPSTPREKLRFTRGAQLRTTEIPPRSRAGRPLRQNSASLEGWTPPRAKLRLARGLDAPSGETPPRSRAICAVGRVSASLEALAGPPLPHPLPDRSIKYSDTTQAPGSKENPRHADPLTSPGNHILALFRQPSW